MAGEESGRFNRSASKQYYYDTLYQLSDASGAFLVNEKAVKMAGWESPLGLQKPNHFRINRLRNICINGLFEFLEDKV